MQKRICNIRRLYIKIVAIFDAEITKTKMKSGIALKRIFALGASEIRPKIDSRQTDMSPSRTNDVKGRKKKIPIRMETISK